MQAWNHIGKPVVDSVQIDGLTRTRYAFVSQITALEPNAVLTDRALALAARRLQDLPVQRTASINYQPDADGFATVKVAIVERPPWPRSAVDWGSIGARMAIDRELASAFPGRTGQGEVWEGSWRWWNNRPRVAASFSAPRAGRATGIWRVDGSWEAQTYDVRRIVREQQAHGGLTFSSWATPHLRFAVSAGLDVWDRRLKTVPIGGSIDQRLFADRVSIVGSATAWSPAGQGRSFQAATIGARLRSSTQPSGFVFVGQVRSQAASADAPLAIWSGAGEGRARPSLLRAHTLLHDGIVDGPVFGRRVESATAEIQRWLTRPALPRVAFAAFVDAANATHRLETATGRPFQLDAGAGVRLRLPGSTRTLRVDYAHGFKDRRANRLTVGIVAPQ